MFAGMLLVIVVVVVAVQYRPKSKTFVDVFIPVSMLQTKPQNLPSLKTIVDYLPK